MTYWWLLAKADLHLPQIIHLLIMFLIYPAYKILKRQREQQANTSRPRSAAPSLPASNAKRSAAAGRPAAPQKPNPQLAEIQEFLKQSRAARPSSPQAKAAARSVRVEPIQSGRGTPVGGASGASLDSRHLDTTKFGARASQMVDDLKRGDAEREEHFQRTFAHKVGRLTDTSVAGPKAIAPDAPEISTVPATPVPPSDWLPLPTTKLEELRRAVMLNEILQRPEHRW
ncbi:MAG TPA: hypothetical protein VGG30_09040 [Pirellulales bacterium]|jgi:hypothetical protein